LIEDYLQIAEHDARRPMNEKSNSSLLLLFLEDWEPKVFIEQWK